MTLGPNLQAATADHLDLLTPTDRAWISEISADHVLDPGRPTGAALASMNRRQRERFRIGRTRFLRTMPLLETPVVTDVMGRLRLLAHSSVRSDLHQQDIPILNGDPGVGKTHIVRTHAAEEMSRLALHRSIDLEDGNADPLVVFRPVLYIHLRGPMTRHDLLRLLCAELRWPSDRNPQVAFETAIKKCGVQLIIIDEIQHVNFDGKTGRDVHNIIRWMSNYGLRVILAGTDIDWVLNGAGSAAVEVAARNSRGRWIRVDVPKLEIGTTAQRDAWLDLVYAFENRLRLAHAPSEDGWLSDGFGMYMWARTQGYLNALVLLINLASAHAIDTGQETINRKILDSIDLEYEVERQRTQRVALFDNGIRPEAARR
ncbi:ATP-binding protein [Leifsonia sp. C5G2]|uniref:ATP-binding protein n=1 Tax=Leifsonia sp. C5G2 TaxID=2735269 RepID=UPI001584F5E5|nr:ATP-binding protein [Leifsonia sp. C5G2]NUU06436.1 ATP-binding protein [Leifsonia sp. C5G2]